MFQLVSTRKDARVTLFYYLKEMHFCPEIFQIFYETFSFGKGIAVRYGNCYCASEFKEKYYVIVCAECIR